MASTLAEAELVSSSVNAPNLQEPLNVFIDEYQFRAIYRLGDPYFSSQMSPADFWQRLQATVGKGAPFVRLSSVMMHLIDMTEASDDQQSQLVFRLLRTFRPNTRDYCGNGEPEMGVHLDSIVTTIGADTGPCGYRAYKSDQLRQSGLKEWQTYSEFQKWFHYSPALGRWRFGHGCGLSNPNWPGTILTDDNSD